MNLSAVRTRKPNLQLQLLRESTTELVTLDSRGVLGAGGEATVYAVPQDQRLTAKVYRKPTKDRVQKLEVMAANPPPDDRTAPEDGGVLYPQLAWPVDLLRTPGRRGDVCGFLMPRVFGMAPIIDVYTPRARLMRWPAFDYQHLVRTARNLAAAVDSVHRAGHVIGDLSHSNVLVSEDAQVTLIDTDSFQIGVPQGGGPFLCPVYTPDFTAPELHHQGLKITARTADQDSFGLGVLVFLLLMGGVHPFTGAFSGKGEPPALFERIASGDFPYSRDRRSTVSPSGIALPFDTLPPTLRELVLLSFEAGHQDPASRPSAAQWQAELQAVEYGGLQSCSLNPHHRFGAHLDACPWCRRTAQLGGRDPFPSKQAVANGQHRRVIPTPVTLSPNRVPEWRLQERRIRAARVRTGTSLKAKHWAVLAVMLWAVFPGLWTLAAWQAVAVLPVVGVLAAMFYCMTAAVVVAAAGVVGWGRATSSAMGGRWVYASALGVPAGCGLIALASAYIRF